MAEQSFSIKGFIVPVFRRMVFTRKIRAEVWQLLADLTAADMDVAQALNTVATVYRQRNKGMIANILLDIRAAIPRNEVQSAIARYASGGESLLFANFADTDAHRLFHGAARIARVELVITRAIQSAVAGPSMIFAILFGILYLAGSQLFPSFLDLQPIETWSLTSRWFAQFTMWFAKQGFWIGLVGACLAILIAVAIPFWVGVGRKQADRFPPFNFYKLRIGASFLFALVESGRIGQAINSEYLYRMSSVGSNYSRDRVRNIAAQVSRMQLGAATLAAGQDFPAKDLNTILNALCAQENWLESLAGFTDRWLEDVESQAKRTAAMLNTALLVLIVSILGLLMNSIFSIIQAISL